MIINKFFSILLKKYQCEIQSIRYLTKFIKNLYHGKHCSTVLEAGHTWQVGHNPCSQGGQNLSIVAIQIFTLYLYEQIGSQEKQQIKGWHKPRGFIDFGWNAWLTLTGYLWTLLVQNLFFLSCPLFFFLMTWQVILGLSKNRSFLITLFSEKSDFELNLFEWSDFFFPGSNPISIQIRGLSPKLTIG